MNRTAAVGSWRVVGDSAGVEPWGLRLPELATVDIISGPHESGHGMRRRIRSLRLELTDNGGLSLHWGRGQARSRWSGSWSHGPNGSVMLTASDGADGSFDGWLTSTGTAAARLDALSVGCGATWPYAVRVRAVLEPAADCQEPPAAEGDGPWGLSFTGRLIPLAPEAPLSPLSQQSPPKPRSARSPQGQADTAAPGEPSSGHPVEVSFGPAPRVCRAATAPAMSLHSSEPGRPWSVLWIAHCTDGAAFTVEPTGTGTTATSGTNDSQLTVRYGPEHTNTDAPVWNIPQHSPFLPDFALPISAETGLVRLALNAGHLTGSIELTALDPFTGGHRRLRAHLDATVTAGGAMKDTDQVEPPALEPTGPRSTEEPSGEHSDPLPTPRGLHGGWRGRYGPLPRLDLDPNPPRTGTGTGTETDTHSWRLTADDRAVRDDGRAVLRLFRPLDLTVGLVAPRTDPAEEPEFAVLTRTEAHPIAPEAQAVWHDRIELRDLGQRLTLERRYAEARPLLRRALVLYRRALAEATLPTRQDQERISALQILEHQCACDAATRDEEALIDRLIAAARLRTALIAPDPHQPGAGRFGRQLVTGTLHTLLAQSHRIERSRTLLDTDEERIAQGGRAAPYHEQLVTALLDLGEPGTALLAAEAGRARAWADLVGRSETAQGQETDTPAPATDAPALTLDAPAPTTDAPAPTLGPVPTTDAPANPAWVFGAPPPLNEERLRRLLARHGTPVVVYHLHGDRLASWTVGADGALSADVRQVPAQRLAAAARTVRLAGLPGQRSSVRQVQEALRWLGDILWPTARDQRLPLDPEQPVAIVPHGVLYEVPFAALPDREGRPLVQRHALTLLPALSLLEGLLDRREAHRSLPSRTPRLLAFVDPEPMPDGLAPLPWTRESFPLVAQLYGEGASTVHSGTAATASRLREAAHDASVLASVLCLATHTQVYGSGPGSPLDSFVALARTADHDGRLRARDLAELPLGADLVILTTCESGFGRITADGVIGLGRPLLVRGPTAVLLSLAPIREEDSLDLVHRFHQHWLHEGAGRAAALRRAQLAWAEMYPDAPARWASAVLLGLGS
ncbi:CHAT domain-containing protein [Streptomyces sp. NPDC059256]|uniref:CHAT domain-containing protein n=1 Tax=Streptomyces sp. NPDC059256 TaxID=3346794 RepID=UPI003691A375